jgi:DNA-binding NarL/FixJ family response regulator
LRWLLEEDGRFVVVGETDDGDEATSQADDADVLVMEIALRGIDGLTALERVRRDKPDVAVVIYSSYSQPYLRSEAMARGAAAYVVKSSGYEEIAEALAAAAAPA